MGIGDGERKMDIFAEPSRREPRGSNFVEWAVCGNMEGHSRVTFKTEPEALAFRDEQRAKGADVVHGRIDIRSGGVWEWSPQQ